MCSQTRERGDFSGHRFRIVRSIMGRRRRDVRIYAKRTANELDSPANVRVAAMGMRVPTIYIFINP